MSKNEGPLRIVVRRELEEPVYVQIARQVRGWIASGRLAPGSILPPVRTLATDLGVNLNTVARAYRSLEEGGFLTIRERSGAVVAAPASEATGRNAGALRGELRELLHRMRQAGIPPEELQIMAAGEIGTLAEGARRAGGARGGATRDVGTVVTATGTIDPGKEKP